MREILEAVSIKMVLRWKQAMIIQANLFGLLRSPTQTQRAALLGARRARSVGSIDFSLEVRVKGLPATAYRSLRDAGC